MSAWVLDAIYGSVVSDVSLRVPGALRKLFKTIGIFFLISCLLLVGRIAYQHMV